MHKNKPIAVVVIVAFLINMLPGAMLNPSRSLAYHNPWDQGHSGSIGGASDSSKPDACPCPPNKSPVNIRTGEFSYSHEDLLIIGRGLPLQVTRSYNSHDVYEGPFGHGWKFNMEIKLSAAASGSQETVSIRTSDGVRRDFTRNPDGSYSPPAGWLDQLVKNGDGSYAWTRGPCTGSCVFSRYQFNSSGYLTSITDPNNNQMTFVYDSSGRLTQVTDAPGRKLSVSYGSNNKIATITDPAARTFTYGYDAGDNLATYTDPAGNITTYGYDSAHNLVSITDARGNVIMTAKYDDQERVTEYTENGAKWTYSYDPGSKLTYKYLPGSWYSWYYYYDANGLVVSETDPSYNYTYYAYNDKLYMVTTTDPKGASTSFAYDDRGNRISITDALGNKATFTYHTALNLVTGMTDPLGRTTTYDYDDRGNLVQVTDALGCKSTRTYDAYGQATSATNAVGDTKTFSYDGNGYLNGVTDANGNQKTFVYDIQGNLTQATDPNGHTTTYTYDVLGNVMSITDALGNTTSFTYDKNSNLISMTDADGKTKTYEYDVYNRINKITDPHGNQTLSSYDVRGNLVSETDPNGNVTLFEYDLMNRPVKQTYPDGTAEQFTYDGVGRRTKITDPKGNATSYDYDAMRRVVKITYTDGYSDSYAYDKVGNVVSWTDRKGNTFTYAYDALNRMTTKTYPDAVQAKYDYDALGRLIAVTNKSSSLTFTYDKVGQVTKTQQGSEVLTFTYDKAGNRSKLFYPNGSSINYMHDGLDRLTGISDSSGNTIASFSYDALSRKTKLGFANGTQASYQYDAASRIAALAHTKTSSGASLATFAYAYDKLDNQVSATTAAGTQTVSYNQKYEVTGVTRPDSSTISYTLDAAGNRSSLANGTTTNYTVNTMNQYTDVGGTAYQYDQKGSLVSGGSFTYQYDYDNNLVQVVTPDGTLNFAYDALGRLISQSLGNDVTKFIYDGDNVVKAILPSGKSRHFINGEVIDEVLAMVEEDGSNSYYYHLDSLGSVAAVSNAAGGVAESYTYDVYGQPTIRNASGSVISKSAIDNPFMFTARIYSNEAKLYHLRARAYSHYLGRFLQIDPAGQLIGGLNLYAYVGNNPVNLSDPLGLGKKLALVTGIVVGGAIIWFTGGLGGPLAVKVGGLIYGAGVVTAGAAAGAATDVTYERVVWVPCDPKETFPWLSTAVEGGICGGVGAGVALAAHVMIYNAALEKAYIEAAKKVGGAVRDRNWPQVRDYLFQNRDTFIKKYGQKWFDQAYKNVYNATKKGVTEVFEEWAGKWFVNF